MTFGVAIAGYWLGIFIVGLSLVSLPKVRRCLPDAAIAWLSFGVGAGMLSLLLFWLSLAGVVPSRPILLAVFGLGTAGLVALKLQGKPLLPRISTVARMTLVDGLLCGVLAVPLLWVGVETLTRPLSNIDAIAIWGLKSKVVFHEPVRDTAYFHDVTKSFSHLDYPLLLPFLTAGQFAIAGGVDEGLAKSIHLWLFLAFGLLVIQALRTVLPLRQTLLLAIVYLSNTMLLAQAAAGIADVALMLYYAGSVYLLLSWATTRDRGQLLVGALLTAFLAFTKNEGTALALINVAVMAFWAILSRNKRLDRRFPPPVAGYTPERTADAADPLRGTPPVRRTLIDVAAYAAVVFALNAAWFVFASDIPRTHEDYLGRLRVETIVENLNRVPVIAEAFTRAVLDIGAWNALWVLLLVSIPAGQRRVDARRAALLWLLLLLHLGMYFVIFIVTPWEVNELLGIKAYPLLLQASPAVVLLIAEYWRGFLGNRGSAQSTHADQSAGTGRQ